VYVLYGFPEGLLEYVCLLGLSLVCEHQDAQGLGQRYYDVGPFHEPQRPCEPGWFDRLQLQLFLSGLVGHGSITTAWEADHHAATPTSSGVWLGDVPAIGIRR
jgi:hypothetical protein